MVKENNRDDGDVKLFHKIIGITSLLKNESSTSHRSENWPSLRSISFCTESEKTMSTHQLLLHSLDCNCSIRFSFSFLQLHLKETKRNEAYQQFLEKILLEEKLRKNILEEKSLAKTCWRKPALTLSLASSSTSSNSSSLERGHSILSANNKNPSIIRLFPLLHLPKTTMC